MTSPSNLLSIIIPAYNEENTIVRVLEKISRIDLGPVDKEIIIVNDNSTDNTVEVIDQYIKSNPSANIHVFSHEKNCGKGSAIHTGIKNSTGNLLIIQDADLEYDPDEYQLILNPILNGFADVVYGSRFMGSNPHRILFFWHTVGNRFLTFLSNVFTNLNLTDMETGFKSFRSEIINKINLKEKRFGFEPEVTAKIARIPGIRIYEVGISYYGRRYEEGKKINWKDGFRALYCILRYNLFR
jgi:glycosyltransferase involved in cell wall biosynthesis